MSNQRVLTGIKPTGLPHIGNYFGAIKPALALSKAHQSLFFIADYHALTTVKEASQFRELSFQVAATWLACGLDPNNVLFYRQSDIPEIFELYWILSCMVAKGVLNRAHAYKALVDNNVSAGRDPDKNINMGLYNYPILMAADILLFNTNVVPVGVDQKQHVEIARDIADAFNSTYGELFVSPEPLVSESQDIILGIDGQKMSKNYNNTIPLFGGEKEIRKRVMKIKTDPLSVEDVKNPDNCLLFATYQLFASKKEIALVRAQYLKGGLAYGQFKQTLFETMQQYFQPFQKQYDHYVSNPLEVEKILEDGKTRARQIAQQQLQKVRHLIGLK